MVVIKNLSTGISTECSNEDVIKICKADAEHYEIAGKEEKAEPKKRVTKKVEK